MKLQLNENELNAYINEAIKQELINETCYRVNFETLGKPANAQTRPMRAKVINALKSGEYGKNNPGKLIKKLREVGYSDEQIQAGIRNGAVQVAQSFDPATGQAVLYDVKTQNKKLQKLLKLSGTTSGWKHSETADWILPFMRTEPGRRRKFCPGII